MTHDAKALTKMFEDAVASRKEASEAWLKQAVAKIAEADKFRKH